MRTAVLIPVKAFRDAKGRLAGRLSPDERCALARFTASKVVDAAGPFPVAVVCDDNDVAIWAESVGARVLWTPAVGLNGAVTDGVAGLAADGFDHVIVAHSDLPLAADLAELAESGTITIVPDSNDGGTNVLALPTDCGFRFAYGAGSFRRHLAEGERLCLPISIRRIAELALDIDTPDDLDHPLIKEVLPWPLTNRVNPV